MSTVMLSSLPALHSIKDAADFSLVQPYLSQLYALPHELLAIATSDDVPKLHALTQLYLSSNPLVLGFAFSLFLAVIVLIVAEVNRNYSQIDRLWSILPTLYVVHYAVWAHANNLPTQRLDNVLACLLTWSARLTFNYWRKGGYQIGSEDYRWEIIGKKIGRLGMILLNITFISFGQSILLFLVSTPAYVLLLASLAGSPRMEYVEAFFSRAIFALITITFFADQQQWDYHQAKALYHATAKVPPNCKFTRDDLDRGFCVSGLWSWSRHPNFVAEQAVWVTLYAWGCYATHTLVNWTAAGALLYLAVFQGSTPITEAISASKYPEYKEYQRLVGRFFPKLFPPESDISKAVNAKTPAEKKKKGGKKDL